MDEPAVVDVERALLRVGISGPALTGIMAMIRSMVAKTTPPDGRTSRCASATERLAPHELPTLPCIARRFLRDSLRRRDVVGTVIEDASWNMMLAVYADAAEGGYTSTTSACYASGAAPTTALRHVERLRQDGLITKHADPFDGRRTLLRPTQAAMSNMDKMIRAFCIAKPVDTAARATLNG